MFISSILFYVVFVGVGWVWGVSVYPGLSGVPVSVTDILVSSVGVLVPCMFYRCHVYI